MDLTKPIINIIDHNSTEEPYSFAPTPKFTSIEIKQVVKHQQALIISTNKQKIKPLNGKKQEDNNTIKISNRQQYKHNKLFQKYQKLIINAAPEKSNIKQTHSVGSMGSKNTKNSKIRRNNQIKLTNSFYLYKNTKNSHSANSFNLTFTKSKPYFTASKDLSTKSKEKSIKMPQTMLSRELKKNYNNFIDNNNIKSTINIYRNSLQTSSKTKGFASPKSHEKNQDKKLVPESIQLFYSSSEKKKNEIRDKGKSFQSILKKTRPALKIRPRILHTNNLQNSFQQAFM